METKQLELSNRLFYVVAVLVGVIVLSLLVSICIGWKNLPGNEAQYLTVNGAGKAFVTPDIAIVSFGITNSGADTATLITRTTTTMNNVISAVKGKGVEEKDIQTTQYNLAPRYEYQQDTGKRVFAGYDMVQTIEVKIRDFAKIGEIFNSATDNGANAVGDLYFSVDNPEAANKIARDQAVANAKLKAIDMANSSGIKLGKLVNVSEGYYYSPVARKESFGMGGSDTVAPAPQIQAGQQEVDITMTLTYRIR